MPTFEQVETAYDVYQARNREYTALPPSYRGTDAWDAAYEAEQEAFAAYFRIATEYLEERRSLPLA